MLVVSTFDLFTKGIGPSASHTVGPMQAAYEFVSGLDVEQVKEIEVHLYGSLALTGGGHGTDKAIILGLMGQRPDTVDVNEYPKMLAQVEQSLKLKLGGTHSIDFTEHNIIWHQDEVLDYHTNGMRLIAKGAQTVEKTYFSVGGGFIVEQGVEPEITKRQKPKFYFTKADELLKLCAANNMSISQIMRANEESMHAPETITVRLNDIYKAMKACTERGLVTTGLLPGGLSVKRRAPKLYEQIKDVPVKGIWHEKTMLWLSALAIAVNEENAAGGQVVTAPTNGAAGIVPAVLGYYCRFDESANEEKIADFLLTAAAIGILCKLNASISGAEVGCQGEVGSASSMAAAGLTAVLGGTPEQVEKAAEIAMEHHLGLTCDPIAGLVQIPCIERNSMGAVKAVNAAQLALADEDASHHVSLDKAIQTMRRTGADMLHIYKETSLGGLAVNHPEC